MRGVLGRQLEAERIQVAVFPGSLFKNVKTHRSDVTVYNMRHDLKKFIVKETNKLDWKRICAKIQTKKNEGGGGA